MHQMMGVALANPVLFITEAEAGQLAKAAGKVAAHYPMRASAEAMDWCGLLAAVFTVYGTRAMVLRASRAAAAPVPTPGPVQDWQPSIIAAG